MTNKQFFTEELQEELKYAFKWMADATKYAQEGNFQMATYDMTLALQHWIKCQNIRDKYLTDKDVEDVDWKSFTQEAIKKARTEAEGE